MKLWKISQDFNDDYDTFDSAIVAAETEDVARLIHPDGRSKWDGKRWKYTFSKDEMCFEDHTWASPEKVSVELIGETVGILRDAKDLVILASFNAG